MVERSQGRHDHCCVHATYEEEEDMEFTKRVHMQIYEEGDLAHFGGGRGGRQRPSTRFALFDLVICTKLIGSGLSFANASWRSAQREAGSRHKLLFCPRAAYRFPMKLQNLRPRRHGTRTANLEIVEVEGVRRGKACYVDHATSPARRLGHQVQQPTRNDVWRKHVHCLSTERTRTNLRVWT